MLVFKYCCDCVILNDSFVPQTWLGSGGNSRSGLQRAASTAKLAAQAGGDGGVTVGRGRLRAVGMSLDADDIDDAVEDTERTHAERCYCSSPRVAVLFRCVALDNFTLHIRRRQFVDAIYSLSLARSVFMHASSQRIIPCTIVYASACGLLQCLVVAASAVGCPLPSLRT